VTQIRSIQPGPRLVTPGRGSPSRVYRTNDSQTLVVAILTIMATLISMYDLALLAFGAR
jgi:hypothetical protein